MKYAARACRTSSIEPSGRGLRGINGKNRERTQTSYVGASWHLCRPQPEGRKPTGHALPTTFELAKRQGGEANRARPRRRV